MAALVFWAIKDRPKNGGYLIHFWTKDDKSDSIEFVSVTLDHDKLRRKIEGVLSTHRFTLCHHKN